MIKNLLSADFISDTDLGLALTDVDDCCEQFVCVCESARVARTKFASNAVSLLIPNTTGLSKI
jgi:hypothetical protein